jgi:hypothetical protein
MKEGFDEGTEIRTKKKKEHCGSQNNDVQQIKQR